MLETAVRYCKWTRVNASMVWTVLSIRGKTFLAVASNNVGLRAEVKLWRGLAYITRPELSSD